MRISAMTIAAGSTAARSSNTGLRNASYLQSATDSSAVVSGSRLQEMIGKSMGDEVSEGSAETAADRTMAEKIYQAAISGKRNPIEELRQKPRVPYEYLAKDGVINYNGVTFVCDYEKNCICLGDMSDESNVLTIALSGGGSLKLNRNNIGELSRAAGMFSPEDLNLIMRAIAMDNKVHTMKEEIDDMEASVGNNLREEVADQDESAGDDDTP